MQRAIRHLLYDKSWNSVHDYSEYVFDNELVYTRCQNPVDCAHPLARHGLGLVWVLKFPLPLPVLQEEAAVTRLLHRYFNNYQTQRGHLNLIAIKNK